MATTAFLALTALQGVHAWGALGHETVGYIAQHYVKDSTAAWAQAILNDTSSSYLANVATWADSYRSTAAGKFSAPFHYIDAEDNPPSSCNVDYDRDCGSAGCSVSAIANYTQRVGDGRLSTAHQYEALKFLVHFLGDITQPLHDEAYKVGGNEINVTFDGYTNDNLHAIWDTYMPEKLVGGYALSDAQDWANTLVSDIDKGTFGSASSWTSGDSISDVVNSAMRWATDANAFVCTKVMPNGEAALEQGDLYPTYYNSVIGTIEMQIAKGGYRLANWLDMIADANMKTKRSAQIYHGRSFKAPKIGTTNVDLTGRDLLPESRPLSRAKMARMAVGYNCNHEH